MAEIDISNGSKLELPTASLTYRFTKTTPADSSMFSCKSVIIRNGQEAA